MIDKKYHILKRQRPWRDAFYYQKAETLYQMTYVFCQRFLPTHGDRTVDQMIQAARSGKQNIVEGVEDGETSTEMYIKLLNVARGSIQELREDYRDYLLSRNKPIWGADNSRYGAMLSFCKNHNRVEDYQSYFQKWNDKEMANIALTLCYMTDTMMNRQLINLEKEFVEQGGIKERMHAARTGYRQAQDEELNALRKEVPLLKAETARLRLENTRLKALLKENGIAF